MTNDELLAGFLERSLNEDQLLELEARKQADPAFANEVNEMLTVEDLLKTSAPRGLAPAGFLVGVESAVAYKIFTSTPASSVVGGWFSSAWTWIAAVGVTLIGAATLFVVNRPSEDVRRPSQDVRRPSSVVQSPAVTSNEPRATNNEPRPTTNDQRATSNEPRATNHEQRATNHEQRATSYEVESTYESTISKLKKDLDVCRSSGDQIRCIQIALQIGRTYRERRLTDESMEYLTLAQREAQQAHIIQYEIDAFGEMGLLMRAAGKTSDANDHFKSAVELGSKNGLDVQRWSSEIR
jgi:tetratricopeptide (TPR) repeat protein